MRPSPALAVGAALLLLATYAAADEHDHEYRDGEDVTLWVNKVGPYHNPQETYSYFSLPFCKPDAARPIQHKHDGLGAVLEGNDMRDSGIHIQFKSNVDARFLCELEFTKKTERIFTEAVRHHYWYQMYIDELPMWGMVGQMMVAEDPDNPGQQKEQAFIYTHKKISISYNEQRIIEVNLTSENPRPIKRDTRQQFTYSVVWNPTERSFDDRFDRYLDFDFFEHQIHWFSIFNSFMMVVFLCGLVVLVLMRTLKNDYIRYTSEDEEMDLDRVIDESGWKQVHGDVFRPPPRLMLYSALLGTGYQLMALVFACIGIAMINHLYRGRGAMLSTFLAVYAFTSLLAGYASGSFYKRNGGTKWKETMFLTAILFPGVSFAVAFMLNFIAIGYQALNAMSIGSMLTMIAMWAFITLPLVVLGTILGRNTATKDDFPCRVNSIRRPIPEGRWYTNRLVLSLIGGILPFGSIFIEMYFVFTSLWNYKFYYVYGFLLLVYVILIIVTVCVTIVGSYCLLNAEDHRWQWTCFFMGGSTGFYVYLYSIYYFFTKTRMSGFFQVSFYFGYTFIFCLALFILCGTIGYMGTSIFIRRIYTYIKSD